MEETKKCPFCKEEINKNATKCPKCQADLRNWFSKHPILTIFLLLFLIWIFWWNSLENIDTTKTINTDTNLVDQEINTNWLYNEKTDEMDWTKTYFASTVSINTIDLSFPYWTTLATLTLRKKWNNKMEVMFLVDEWQILSYDKKARIKFDDSELMLVDISWTSAWSSNVIFLSSENIIIEKLKTAKTVMIEVEYYQDWMKLSKFNVEWLSL